MADFHHVLLVTDLDGTFFGRGARLVERNLRAVERFKALGGRFTVATGRIRPNIEKAIPDCAALFNAPAITANGAYIHDFATGECVHCTPMDAAAVKEAVCYAQALNPRVGMRISTDSGFLVNADRLVPAILHDIGDPATFKGALVPAAEWVTEGARWYKVVMRGEPEDLLAIRPLVEARCGDVFEYSTSSPRFYEMQAKGCTKATGLRLLADRLAAEDGHPILTVAVGDQENDLPMLRAADLSGCPENALDAVKEAVRFRLCHCDEGCVADLIERVEAWLSSEKR